MTNKYDIRGQLSTKFCDKIVHSIISVTDMSLCSNKFYIYRILLQSISNVNMQQQYSNNLALHICNEVSNIFPDFK